MATKTRTEDLPLWQPAVLEDRAEYLTAEALTQPVEAAPPGYPGGTGTATATVMLDGKSVQVTIGLRTEDVTPPPVPELTGITLTPAAVEAGGVVNLRVTVNATSSNPIDVLLTSNVPHVPVPAAVTIRPGTTSQDVPIQTSAAITADLSAILTATYRGFIATAKLQVTAKPLPPPPPPTYDINVRDKGAKGDGTTLDWGAFQSAIDSVKAGGTIYVPPGTYVTAALSKSIAVYTKGNWTLLGEGDASVLKCETYNQFKLGVFQTVPSIAFRKLKFLGRPNAFKPQSNYYAAIENTGVLGMVVEDCTFQGCGWAVFSTANARDSRITNVRVDGWGECAFFAGVGDQFRQVRAVQNDPTTIGGTSSHGFYIHGTAKGVLLEDVHVENARNYVAQLWSQQHNTTIEGITFRRVTAKGCRHGITLQQGTIDAGRVKNALFEDCTISGSYDRSAAAFDLKQGDGIVLRRCVAEGSPVGIQLGEWQPYSVNFTLTGVRVEECTVRNCQIGVKANGSFGGTFRDCVVGPVVYEGNTQNTVRTNDAGILWR